MKNNFSLARTMSSLFARLIFKLRYRLRPMDRIRTVVWRALGMEVGRGTILPKIFVTWPSKVSIGEQNTIEHLVYFHYDGTYSPGASIVFGSGVFIGSGCEFNIKSKILIGSNCAIASGCRFIDHDHDISGVDAFLGPDIEEAIEVQDFAWIGANAVILRGVTIGRGSVIAAGAVVKESVPSGEVWAGVPARKVGERTPE